MNTVLESLLLGVFAAVGWGISDFVAAVVAKRLGVLRTVVGANVFSIVAASGYFLFATDMATPTLSHWTLLAGIAVISVVIYIAFYKALQVGPVAIISPVVSAYAVVVILLAFLFLGERLSSVQVLAAAASVAGIMLASINLGALTRPRELISLGVALAILAMLCIGVWQFWISILSREIGWFLPVYLGRVMTLALFVPLVAARRQWPWQRLTVPLVAGIAVIGLTETAGLFAFARGAEVGVISIVAAASITYPFIPMLGGLFIFKEELRFTQFVGLAIALAGLLLLAVS